jgi:hypothetical protein
MQLKVPKKHCARKKDVANWKYNFVGNGGSCNNDLPIGTSYYNVERHRHLTHEDRNDNDELVHGDRMTTEF